MWKEVFKAGKHTDANGNEREWSSEDIDAIISKYNNQMPDDKHEAPVVIGHPVNNSPAYAWVESLKKDGETLLAKFTQIDPEFEQLIKEGRYKKVSIALYPDMMLRHIGFLGAIPPAVKGLKDSVFIKSEASLSVTTRDGSLTLDSLCQVPIRGIQQYTPTRMSISPNPTDGELKVSIGTQEQGSFSLVVFNVQGREVYRSAFSKNDKTFEQKDYNINTQNMGNGIYTIHLIAPWTLLREQVVVVR